MSRILLEANGLVIREDARFWIYVITHKQWTQLNRNLENDILYCSTYAMYSVRKNDIIAIYKKDPKTGGFIGVAQVYSDMHNNNKGISIYGDQNMDNNLVEFEQITILSIPIKISKITCFAQTIYKKYQSFSSKMLQGDCSLREMDNKSGLVLIDHLIRTTSGDTVVPQTTLNSRPTVDAQTTLNSRPTVDAQPTLNARPTVDAGDHSIDSKIEAIRDELICCELSGSDLIDRHESSHSIGDESDESDEEIKNTEIKNTEIKNTEIKNTEIKNTDIKKARRCRKYIPVMLCGCKLIEKDVHRIIRSKGSKKSFNENNFMKLMMRHYDDCEECEFTNNNDGDIGHIIRQISSDRVHIYFDHTLIDDTIEELMDKTFNSYLLAEPYSSSDINHLNIYLIDEYEYKGAIVFEWINNRRADD